MAQPNYRQLARQKAQHYGLDPNIFERQINAESGFNPNAKSPVGALGIAQIMPSTAKGWGVNPSDPAASLDAAARNMAQYVHKYGSYKDALVAYNAGPGRVGGSLPAETQAYIKTILGGSNPKALSVPATRYKSVPAGGTPSSSTDNRTALALSLLGEGGGSDLTSLLGGISSSYGVDPLQLAITAALQRHQSSATPASSTPRGTPAPTSAPTGKLDLHTSYVDGKPVVGWIASILKKAKAAGWHGTVTSGERTKSEQLSAARNFGLQHYPNGPLASNHVVGHDGAVDVSDPNGLKAVLRKLGVTQLKSSMADDPVHFSRSGH